MATATSSNLRRLFLQGMLVLVWVTLFASARAPERLRAQDSDILPGPGGSFPWSPAPTPESLYDRSKPLPEPGGRFGSVPTRAGAPKRRGSKP